MSFSVALYWHTLHRARGLFAMVTVFFLPWFVLKRTNKISKFGLGWLFLAQRGVSIKSTPISLILPSSKDKSYLLNLFDTPGKIFYIVCPSVCTFGVWGRARVELDDGDCHCFIFLSDLYLHRWLPRHFRNRFCCVLFVVFALFVSVRMESEGGFAFLFDWLSGLIPGKFFVLLCRRAIPLHSRLLESEQFVLCAPQPIAVSTLCSKQLVGN